MVNYIDALICVRQKQKEIRACLHGGGGPQVGEVTCLGRVKK